MGRQNRRKARRRAARRAYWQSQTKHGPESERPRWHPLDVGLRPPRRWLVSALGHHLGQAESHAGIGDRPANQEPRIPVPAGEKREILLRRGGDQRGIERLNRWRV